MGGNSSILENVVFEKAKVTIYSLNHGKAFTYVFNRHKKARRDTARSDADSEHFLSVFLETNVERNWHSTDAPRGKRAGTGWRHGYLPTSRLYVSDAAANRKHDTGTTLSESALERQFNSHIKTLWNTVSSRMLGQVRLATETGLASILKDVMSNESTESVIPATDIPTTYRRVSSFLKRQKHSDIHLGSEAQFAKRIASNAAFRKVVSDLNSVEIEIEKATRPQAENSQIFKL